MDLDKLNTFYHVANYKSLTLAAEELKIDKSSISRQISTLEAQVKRKLFDRVGKQFILTPEGEFLLEKARNILYEIEATKNHLLCGSTEISGSLRISTTYALLSTWLSKFIHLFLNEYPKIKLDIFGSSEELNLSLREADVAIRPISSQNNEGLIQNYLKSWRLNLYAHKKYVEKFGMPTCIDDLDDHRLITFGKAPTVYSRDHTSWILYFKTKNGKMREPYITTNSIEAMINLVLEGVGIAPLSNNIANELDLIPIFPDLFFHDVEAYYIYPAQYKNVPKIIAFENFIRKQIKVSETSDKRKK